LPAVKRYGFQWSDFIIHISRKRTFAVPQNFSARLREKQ